MHSVSKTLVDDDDVVAVHRPPRRNKNNSRNHRKEGENGVAVIPARCSKGDGKGWWCKKEAKQGHSLCEHHLYPRSNNHHNNNDNYNGNVAPSRPSQPGNKRPDKPIPPPPPPPPAKAARRRGRVLKKPSNFSNPYEFYYYSGFGPKWSKRRGGRGAAGEDKSNAAAENGKDAMSSEASLSSIDNSNENGRNENENSSSNNGGGGGGGVEIEFMDDYDFDDDEDDEDNEEGKNGKGRKRGRKMVKARSLKSLM